MSRRLEAILLTLVTVVLAVSAVLIPILRHLPATMVTELPMQLLVAGALWLWFSFRVRQAKERQRADEAKRRE